MAPNTHKPFVGIGLRHPHLSEVATHTLPQKPLGFLEVHTENFFSLNSPAFRSLEKIRSVYPISAHCVGLSLGSTDGVEEAHLKKVAAFIQAIDPMLVSDHVSFSRAAGYAVPDLLPVPMSREALGVMANNILKVQDVLGRAILVENPSCYLQPPGAEMGEPEFLNELCQKTGCKLLLDINNIYVTCHNLEQDAEAYLDAVDVTHVAEIHLAGHAEQKLGEGQKTLKIDTHGKHVDDAVWALYGAYAERFMHTPVCIEWDNDVPEFSVLVKEAEKAAYLTVSERVE